MHDTSHNCARRKARAQHLSQPDGEGVFLLQHGDDGLLFVAPGTRELLHLVLELLRRNLGFGTPVFLELLVVRREAAYLDLQGLTKNRARPNTFIRSTSAPGGACTEFKRSLRCP